MKFFYLFVPTNMNCLQQTIDIPLEMKTRFLEYLYDGKDILNLSIALGKDFYITVRQESYYIWNTIYQNIRLDTSFKPDIMNHFQFMDFLNRKRFPLLTIDVECATFRGFYITKNNRIYIVKYIETNNFSSLYIENEENDPNTISSDMNKMKNWYSICQEFYSDSIDTGSILSMLFQIISDSDFKENGIAGPHSLNNFLQELKQIL